MKLYTKYQRPESYGFRQEDVLNFLPLPVYVKQMSQGGVIFNPRAEALLMSTHN